MIRRQTALIQFPGGRAGSYPIPNRVASIGTNAFTYCSGLTNVPLGNGVTSHRLCFALLLLLALCLRLCSRSANAATAPASGTPFDLQGFIDREVKAGSKRIVVPPGRYRVTPSNREHLALRGLKDITILAEGVEMICTETTRALTISRCPNVTVRGLGIDYDPLPFTQGRITGFAADRKSCDVELFEGYPPAEMVRNFKCEIFRSDTRTLRCEDRWAQKVRSWTPGICGSARRGDGPAILSRLGT